MEGAALRWLVNMQEYLVCSLDNSNYVEKRNKSNWDIPLAIQNLNKELTKFLAELLGLP